MKHSISQVETMLFATKAERTYFLRSHFSQTSVYPNEKAPKGDAYADSSGNNRLRDSAKDRRKAAFADFKKERRA